MGEGTSEQEGEFEPEEWAAPEDHEAIQQATEGMLPEQLGIALNGVLQALAGSGELDCEALAVEMMTTPERALEAVTAVLDANVRMVTARLFNGDQDLHTAFARWAIQNERDEYVRASERVARSQSSKPMLALVQKHMAAVKAMQPKSQPKQSPRTEPAKQAQAPDNDEEPWWERQEREWYEARGLKY